MPKTFAQSVPYFEHPRIDTAGHLNWEDVRVFLCVARAKSFRTAAGTLGISFNTARRHVDRLERMSRMKLFARHAMGVELTREGLSFWEAAVAMETAAHDVALKTRRGTPAESGRVRLTVTEGLGTLWLVPRFVRFQRAHPNLILEVNCTFREPDIARMEMDIFIQLGRPSQTEVKAVRLGHLHVMPFASPDYLRIYGTPKTLRDVEHHKIVEQLSPQLDVSAVDRLFPEKRREGFVSFVTNTSTAHLWAVTSGGGLGMLPTYVSCLGLNVVPVDVGLTLSHEIWMCYHSDARQARRVSLTLDFIKANFDSTMFPWFAEKFIHPRDLLEKATLPENSLSSFLMR